MRRKILSLQGLRVIAFLGVFLSHTNISFFSSSDIGAWGVSVFLILSGFLMVVNYYKQDRVNNVSLINNLKFSLGKLSKLYFLHIMMMIAALPFAFRAIQKSQWLFYDFVKLLAKIVCNVTLTQSFIPHSAIYYSLNAVAWYLSVCLFLYFCFPYILRFFENVNVSKLKAKILIFLLFVLQITLCFIGFIVSCQSNKSYGIALLHIPHILDILNIPHIPHIGCGNISDNFTKWFVYIFPIMRLIEFLIGAALGYLFLHRDDKMIKQHNKIIMLPDICILSSFTLIAIMLFTPPQNYGCG